MPNKKKVIVFIDGGFCSQMMFVALGMFLEDHGYDVQYDLGWFKKYGKDMNNKFDRSFVMQRALPELKLNIASAFKVWIYKQLFWKKWSETKLPKHLYIKEYSRLSGPAFEQHKDVFIKHLNPIDLYLVQDLLDEIQENESCAVHVRRGDLSCYTEVYGMPPTPEHFIRAMNYILEKRPNTVFYFFSDEVDFVRNEIVPKLDKKIKYKICDKNGSDKGYLDFYLMTRANSIIASHGSFGKKAAILNINPDLLFVTTKDFDEK